MAQAGLVPDIHARNVCKIGRGPRCCRYLTMGSRAPWRCERFTEIGRDIDHRVAGGTMGASGVNCPGLANDDKPPFDPNG